MDKFIENEIHQKCLFFLIYPYKSNIDIFLKFGLPLSANEDV